MCWRQESRNGFSASGYAAPTAFDSATEFSSSADTAAVTDGSFMLPRLSTAVFSAMPARYTCWVSRWVSPARSSAAGVAVEAEPLTAATLDCDAGFEELSLEPQA